LIAPLIEEEDLAVVVSTPRVDDPMILVVAMVAFCIFIIIIFFESINLQ
tara:strand:+ start:761 stop:907 length:147 start_codon:yes stop_codon:yes gene_type:complete